MPTFHDHSHKNSSRKDEDFQSKSSETEEQEYEVQDARVGNVFTPTSAPDGPANVNRWLGALQRTSNLASKRAVFRTMQGALGNRSSTIVARLYNQARGVIQRITIAGYNMSSHSVVRGGQRGIPDTEIESAIENGTQYDDGTGKGGVVFYEGDVAVVTMGKTIVTVYRTPRANKPKARWTAL